MDMTEKEAIGIIQRTYNVSVPAQEDEELFEDAIEMALKALDLTQKLKELGYCHNYQHETSYLVNWIDSVNRMLLEYEKTDISGQAETGCNNAALLCNDKLSKEPGELIKVPVKLKQTVYRVNKGAEIPIIPMVVTKLQITTNNSEPVVSFCCIDEDFGETCYFEQDINQRVFLTAEAAVQKLAVCYEARREKKGDCSSMQDYDVYYAGGEKFTEIKATCISKACRSFIDTLSKEAKYTLHSKEYASIRYTDNFSISADYVIMARSLN